MSASQSRDTMPTSRHGRRSSSSPDDPYAEGARTRVENVPLAEESSQFPGTENVPLAQVFEGPGYTSPARVTNALAYHALNLTIAGVIIAVLLPVSLILGVVALIKAQRLPQKIGERAALGATVVSAIALILWALVIYLGIVM
ncbi:DUF4190 domain-containing protein [Schaalia sp. ZJ405]|uniref:DUF4190 domain-containing protein n=1 Tax=Schaalia sp. ZJ405 TaxID=2709403 RepID=UPI0013E9C188|nr:DUF4190 domain-containing protein [Schaalia sp. ZJ405]QPK81475.1 DUF4190 domain-containing protein [Schaalia sp. ZJ405]